MLHNASEENNMLVASVEERSTIPPTIINDQSHRVLLSELYIIY
jgi:hypothetical protein